jgi:hypothetical protein
MLYYTNHKKSEFQKRITQEIKRRGGREKERKESNSSVV